MASSEGQTELLTGWSCIVHQPSEDPEPSELPSTVDITAFSAGLNIEPSTNTQTEECSESGSESESGSNNSGSDGSGSCSVSDSSDSDSSSSSSSSRSSSPEFSVTSSQTNGLRLKIATVRKSCGSPAVTEKEKPATKAPPPEKPVAKPCNLSSSSESGDSDSESDSNETESSDGKESAKQEKVKEVPVNKKVGKIKGKAASVEKKVVEKKTQQKKEVVSPKNVRKTRSKRKKMASLPISRSSTSSSSDSDESDADSAMLASCSLQEIRQEDLAAILPDQQECDAFGAFEEAERNSPQTGDASGSDIELPQQAVNALIQRTTESSSESESHPPPNPNSLYANSLLQQFVAQTQMINTTSGTSVNDAQAETTHDVKKNNETEIKRKRGRPKKLLKTQKIVEKNEYCADPNVSPDSGIQNSPDHTSSPDCSPRPINKSESQKRLNRNNKNSAEVKQSKHIVTSNRFDRILYGNTDRVLYPPRRKVGRPALVKKGPGRPPKISKSDNKTSKKQSELKEGAKIESVKENGRTSQVKENSKSPLVKESTAKTLITKEHTKVEKKEYSKDKKDNSKLDRKENSKTIISKSSSVKENIRVQSKENGKASVARTKHSNTESKEKLNGNTKESKTTKSSHLHEICERVSKRLETTSTEKSEKEPETKEKEAKQKQVKCSNRAILTSKNKIDKSKNKYLMLKNAKLMHSKHKHKKHKKCKFKILKPLSAAVSDPKLNTEIEKLVQDFVKLCCISSSKPAKENVPEILKALKKVSKKRKTSEYGDRKKKKQNTTNAVEKGATSNEQRLPLKKRHYHLSASNNESKEDTLKVNEVSEDAKTKQKIVVEETFDIKSKKSLQEPVENKAKQKTLAKLDEHSDTKTKKSVNKIEDLIDVKNKLKTEKVEENDGKQKRESFVNSKTTLQKDQDDPIDCKHRQKNIVTNKVVKSEKIEALNKTPINKQNDTISSKFSGINNNEYEIKAHIDEAIEACISKYNGKQKMKALEIKVETLEDHERNQKVSPNLTSPKKKGCEAIKIEAIDTQKNILTTTPKKRHRLEMANLAPPEKLVDEIKIEPSIENVVSEIRMRRNLNSVVKKIETSATHVNTRQKNRLDDITSNLSENAAQMNTRQKNRLDEASSNLIENGAQMNTRQKNRLDEATPTLTENNVQINTRQKNRLDEATPTLTENNVQINTRQKNRLDETTPTLTENNVQINTRQKNRLDEATPTLTENNVQINTRQKNRLDEATPTLTENNVQINTRKKNRLDETTSTLTENNVLINTRQKNRLDDITSISTESGGQMNTRQKNRHDHVTSNLTENSVQMNTRQKNRSDDIISSLTENTAQMNTRQKNRLEDITSNLTENAAQMNTRQKSRQDETILTENVVQMNTRQKNRLDENTVNLNTRKKNRLEDLASNLVSKISENSEIQNASKQKKEDRATVIKYPASKNTTELDNNVQKNVDDNKILKKVKGKTVGEGEKMLTQETVKNDLATVEKKCDDKLGELATPPAGVFTPTVDLESHLIKKEKLEAKVEDKPKSTVRIENRKKIKKRRAINRTGFPTIKKKKKKIIPPPLPEPTIEEIKPSPCERVPKDGEEYSSFVERTEKTSPWPKKPTSNFIERVEIDEKKPPPSPTNKTNIDKVNEAEEVKTKDKSSDDEEDAELINVGKWEVLSECDSLPLEDRIDYDFSLKRRRDSHSSDLDDLTLEARLQRLKKTHKIKRKRETLERKCNTENAAKKRLRDISPASSIEPYMEKRLLREDRASASSDESRKTKKTPRWRKKYLIAGLFSDYYKEGDEAVKQKRTELAMKTSKITYHPHEHPYGLLPAPYHCGKYLRCRKIPFQLPYDLWWQHTHSQLPGRDIVPSWNYRKIRTNVYNVKNTTGACEPQACNCSSQSGCGDDCINRLVLAECPASHKCKNQKIQRHDWSPGIEKFMTEYKGWGVKTNLPIKNGDFILEYVGEVVSDQEFKERMATRYIHDTHHYCLHLDGGLVIDGHRMGGDGRFVNHSCAPNCEMQKWSVNGQFRMALFALRDIKAGEELTYDYNFSLFNPADGQECRCDSDNCRGVIGGKSQRIKPALPVAPSQPGRVGRPRKNQAKKALNEKKEIPAPSVSVAPSVANSVNMKPISHAQRLFILEHHCFLIRNLKKVKKVRERSSSSASVLRNQAPTPTNQSTFFNNLNALRQPRNMKTRRVALVDENPELKKSVQLANVLRDIFNAVTESKDENNEKLCTPFMYCPSKRKLPDYYTKVADPIDFTTIEQNIDSGVYKTVETFDADMNKLFDNSIKFYGRSTELGISAVRLKKIYSDVKKESMPKFENVLGVKPPAKFISNKKKGEEEDIIRCICGMYRDEGLMIQCERCLVWQHCECVRADENAPSYHCENCVPRKVDYEISLDEYTEHGHQYYMTLLRGDLQLRQGDTVYVLRDIPIPGTDKKHTYDTIGEIKYTDLDIFRIERLWKDCKNGQRFAYGHHYLRPHETYHEPTRKFFPNEVMRVPLYEAVPVELIISHCWVMDLNTFCKGRPIGAPEDHIYICEYRVDKSARLFSKVSKSKFPICTKTYAFERFDVRLKVSRTYTPHDLDPAFVKQRGRKPQETECSKESIPVQPVNNVPVIRTPVDQKARLNTILLKLISKMPTKQVIDVTYLLEGGRRRKKQT